MLIAGLLALVRILSRRDDGSRGGGGGGSSKGGGGSSSRGGGGSHILLFTSISPPSLDWRHVSLRGIVKDTGYAMSAQEPDCVIHLLGRLTAAEVTEEGGTKKRVGEGDTE